MVKRYQQGLSSKTYARLIATEILLHRHCITGLVLTSLESISLRMIIRMYNENHVDRSSSYEESSTRHVSEITAIASEFGNSAKIIVPRSWLGRRVIAFLLTEYISKHHVEQKPDE